MKQYWVSIFFLITLFSCSSNEEYEKEVVFFLQTDEPELISDYNYHVGHIQEYYLNKDIKITKIEDRVFETGSKEISIKDDASFAMILIDKNGDYKVDYLFGTDVDLMMEINDFFNLK